MKYVYVITSCSIANYSIDNKVHGVYLFCAAAKEALSELMRRESFSRSRTNYYIDKRKLKE